MLNSELCLHCRFWMDDEEIQGASFSDNSHFIARNSSNTCTWA